MPTVRSLSFCSSIAVVLGASLGACGSDSASTQPSGLGTSNAPATSSATGTTPIDAPATGPASAACTPDAMLPELQAELPGDGLKILGVDVQQCQNGYARVFARFDTSGCGQAGGECVEETEQVFLADAAGVWRYLTSGSGIACEDGATITAEPDLPGVCEALGLR